jgi:hypothetical protein
MARDAANDVDLEAQNPGHLSHPSVRPADSECSVPPSTSYYPGVQKREKQPVRRRCSICVRVLSLGLVLMGVLIVVRAFNYI